MASHRRHQHPASMPLLPCPEQTDCFRSSTTESDDNLLFCEEDARSFSDDEEGEDRNVVVIEEDEEKIVMAVLVEVESNFVLRSRSVEPIAAWSQSVDWIIMVSNYYRFRPLTTYLAVNYMDRFLRNHQLPHPSGWPMQLLSVACLSLATKMEETTIPTLLDLQIEDARFVFEPRTICRMEFLVLQSLNWRLGLVTPFAFVDFFTRKIDNRTKRIRHLNSRVSRIILHAARDPKIFEYYPSAIAAAAIICATDEMPDLSSIANLDTVISWYSGLTRDGIVDCYQLLQELVVVNSQHKSPRKDLPSNDGVITTHSSCKRRKLNNSQILEDDKEMT